MLTSNFLESTGLTFEEFATDHQNHVHCCECKGCILDTRTHVQTSRPVWCVNCRDIIKALTLKGRKTPWEKMPGHWITHG